MIAPDLHFWTPLLARIAVEAACVVGVALLLDRLIRPAFWRRALWQGAVISLLLLTASELSGLGRGLASFLVGRARPEQKWVVSTNPVETAPLPLPSPPPSVAPAPLAVPAAVVKPAPGRPVWWPGLLWLAGGLVILGRVAAAQILFISLHRRLDHVQGGLNDRVPGILRRLGVRRTIRLLQSPALTGPIAFGVLRPAIALPVDFAARFSRAEQDAMLAHELAHLASLDPLWYFLADLASAALWWHPQAWWARHRLHRASELAADEAAALFPEGPTALAECLVTLGKQMTRLPGGNLMRVEGGGFRSHLAERVQHLLRLAETARQPACGWRSRALKFGAVIAIPAMAVGLSGCLQSRDAVKQPTLQANLSQSWETSPASTIWHSALPLKRAEPPPTPIPAKFLPSQEETASPGLGTFHIELNSGVRALWHLFPKDADAQPGILLNRYFAGVGIDLTNPGSFTLLNPRTGDILARATMRNLDSMAQAMDLLNKIPPVDSVDRARELVNKTRTTGSIFLDKRPPERPSLETGPFTRLYPMVTRMYHMDPNTFLQVLRDVFPQIPVRQAGAANAAAGGAGPDTRTNAGSLENEWLTRCFGSLGINFTNKGAGVFFNPRTGDILVQGTMTLYDITAVEQVMQLLNKVPPEVQIDVKFADVPYNNTLGFQLPLPSITNWAGAAQEGAVPSFQGPSTLANPSGVFPPAVARGSNPAAAAPALPSDMPATGLAAVNTNAVSNAQKFTGILTDPQYRVIIQAVEQREGSDILSAPRVTTLSGRQTRITVHDNVAPGDTNSSDTGPAVDVLPTVLADGFSIQLAVKATLWEFSPRYEDAGAPPPPTGVTNPPGASGNKPYLPMPHYRVRNTVKVLDVGATVKVWDGETVVLGGGWDGPPPTGTNQAQKPMVFITPRIIDPAGNLVHTDDELKDWQKNILPQPQGTNALK